MNIRHYHPLGFAAGTSGKGSRLQRRFKISSHRFLKNCMDLMNDYEAIQLRYDLLLDRYKLRDISVSAYRQEFGTILVDHKALLNSYGRSIDAFINTKVNIQDIMVSDKIHFERIVDLYQLMQRQYILMQQLSELPAPPEEACRGMEELSPESTSLVFISSQSLHEFTLGKGLKGNE